MINIRKMWKIDEILNHLVRPDSFRIYTFYNKFEFTNGSGHPYPFLGVCIITCKKVVIYPKLVFSFSCQWKYCNQQNMKNDKLKEN